MNTRLRGLRLAQREARIAALQQQGRYRAEPGEYDGMEPPAFPLCPHCGAKLLFPACPNPNCIGLDAVARYGRIDADFDASEQITKHDAHLGAVRDPRIDPQDGDALRKWEQTFFVARVTQGCVFTWPSLSAHRDWVGLLYFRAWAKDADVLVHAHLGAARD